MIGERWRRRGVMSPSADADHRDSVHRNPGATGSGSGCHTGRGAFVYLHRQRAANVAGDLPQRTEDRRHSGLFERYCPIQQRSGCSRSRRSLDEYPWDSSLLSVLDRGGLQHRRQHESRRGRQPHLGVWDHQLEREDHIGWHTDRPVPPDHQPSHADQRGGQLGQYPAGRRPGPGIWRHRHCQPRFLRRECDYRPPADLVRC